MAKVKRATKLESCRFFRPTYLAQVLRLIPFIDPNHSRQPSLSLHDLCLEFLTVHGNEMRLFWAKVFPIFILLMPDIAAVRKTFNVFSYDVVWAELRTHHLNEPTRMLYVLCHGHGKQQHNILRILRIV